MAYFTLAPITRVCHLSTCSVPHLHFPCWSGEQNPGCRAAIAWVTPEPSVCRIRKTPCAFVSGAAGARRATGEHQPPRSSTIATKSSVMIFTRSQLPRLRMSSTGAEGGTGMRITQRCQGESCIPCDPPLWSGLFLR